MSRESHKTDLLDPIRDPLTDYLLRKNKESFNALRKRNVVFKEEKEKFTARGGRGDSSNGARASENYKQASQALGKPATESRQQQVLLATMIRKNCEGNVEKRRQRIEGRRGSLNR